MAPNKSINIHLNDFEGDAATFHFFKTQFLNIVKINGLSKTEACTLLKSKLRGAALKYVIEAPDIQEIEDHDLLLDKLQVFFVNFVSNNSLTDLQNLALLPGENIVNLAHRIRVLTRKVYPSITNVEALQSIQLVSFLQAVPIHIKARVVDSKLTNFEDAVKFANDLYEQYARNNCLNVIQPDVNNACSSQVVLEQLQQQINVLTNAEYPNTRNDNNTFNQQRPQQTNRRSSNFRNQFNRNNSDRHLRFKASTCHFCGKRGHLMKSCRQFLHTIRNNQTSSNNTNNRAHPRSRLESGDLRNQTSHAVYHTTGETHKNRQQPQQLSNVQGSVTRTSGFSSDHPNF
jgi:hypothetical protein